MFIQVGLTWVMGGEFSVVAVEPPLHLVFFSTWRTSVPIPSMASCKLKHSLYHLIHSSTTCMQMLYPIRSSVIYPIMLPLMTTNLLFQTDRGKKHAYEVCHFSFQSATFAKGVHLAIYHHFCLKTNSSFKLLLASTHSPKPPGKMTPHVSDTQS